MQRILHIRSSPRANSFSTSAAERFLSDVSSATPTLEIDRLNLWNVDLPSLDGEAISAKYARLAGQSFTPGHVSAWAKIEEVVARIDRADRIVISTPLWNFGIPYRLKHLIDVITQPGLSFSFSPEAGYRPLLRNRPALVILSSAGDYREGLSRGRPDLATPYLREALGFIGIADLSFVAIGPTAGPPDTVSEAAERAEMELAELALRWVDLARTRAA